MKKSVKFLGQILLGVACVLTLMFGKTLSSSAISVYDGIDAVKGTGMPEDLVGEEGVFVNITNTVLYAVGIISVVMLIWGGVRYIISGGDEKKVTAAKNTVLYAILGLIIALLSYAIVNFVLNVVGTGETSVTEIPDTSESAE